MSTGNMYRCRVIHTGVPGGPYYYTGYFDATLGGTASDASGAWWTFASNTAGSLPTASVISKDTTVQTVDSVTGDIVAETSVGPASVTGTNTGELLPPMTQFLVSWRTGAYENGRQVRGRTNIGAMFETYNDGQGVPNTTVTSTYASKASMLLAFNTAPFVIYSKKNGTFYKATSATMPTKWAVLRSRRP